MDLVTCDKCDNTSLSGWGDLPTCLDCTPDDQICPVHYRTFDTACPLDH